MSPSANSVSFTIRRPSPVSRASSTGVDSDPSFKIPALPRHLSSTNGSTPGSPLRKESPKPNSRTYAERDSSDEDEVIEDELVTGFDQFGVQRLHEKKKPQGPLVIPALKNKDWRDLARKRKQLFVPPSSAATTGADGSVGGLGTRDTINSGPQVSGLQRKKKARLEEDDMQGIEEASLPASPLEEPKEEETEDQKAIRALLSSVEGGEQPNSQIDIIPAVNEDDAFRQDVQELPESSTLDDYERVPVSQFGAALLRGMGWKEGTAANRKGKGPVEPWLPQTRPALLGIGAKEKEVFDDGSKGKKSGKPKQDKRYVPLMKVERSNGEDKSTARSSSKRRSPSPDGRRDRDRERDRDASDKEGDRLRRREREKERERARERGHHRDRKDYSSSRYDKERNNDKRRDYSRDRSEGRRDRDHY